MESNESLKILESLVGEIVIVQPQSLINSKCLFTTQDWVDDTKLKNAVNGLPDLEEEMPNAWVSFNKKGKIQYTLDDGNHRVAIACLYNQDVPLYIEGILGPHKKRYGFNKIVQMVYRRLGGIDYFNCLEI